MPLPWRADLLARGHRAHRRSPASPAVCSAASSAGPSRPTASAASPRHGASPVVAWGGAVAVLGLVPPDHRVDGLAQPTCSSTAGGYRHRHRRAGGRPGGRRSTPMPTPRPRDAAWFQVARVAGRRRRRAGRLRAAGHGAPGRRDVAHARRRSRSAASFKTLLRLHAGDGMQAVPVYLPGGRGARRGGGARRRRRPGRSSGRSRSSSARPRPTTWAWSGSPTAHWP